MAKPKKTSTDASSPLGQAWALWRAGDMVAARRLAQQVARDGGAAEDPALVGSLAAELGLPEGATAAQVAADVAVRTSPPARSLVFGFAALAVLAALVAMARARYG